MAGNMASMASKSSNLGFFGAIDNPLIRKFKCG